MRRYLFLGLLLAGLARGPAADTPPRPEDDLLAGAPAPLAAALRGFAGERDRWAYTERYASTDRKGRPQESRTIRFDPSLAPEDRWTLLEKDGAPPSEREQRKYRREMAGVKRIRLGEYLQVNRAVLVRESATEQVYDVPLRKENNDRLPPEKFQVLVTLQAGNGWRLAAVDVVLREPMRVAVVAKVRKGGAGLRFDTVAPEYGPVVRSVYGQGEATVLLVKVGGAFTAERSDFKRVTPFDERFQVKLGELDFLDI